MTGLRGMIRKQLTLLLPLTLAALLGVASAAQGQTPDAATTESALYGEAMRSLAADQQGEAVALLIQLLEQDPQHAGAWLDLAISHCKLGHAAEAERLFKEIELRFAPPPGILEIIRAQRAQGCIKVQSVKRQLALTVARGYDSNVNQATSNPLFTTSNGTSIINWQLAPDFLARADRYTTVTADYTQPINALGALGVVQGRILKHDAVSQQDTTAILVGLVRPWQAGIWRGQGTAAFGLLQLDGQLYQRQALLQLRTILPVPLPQRFEWAVSGTLLDVAYPTRIIYSGKTAELGTTVGYSFAATQVQASLAVLSDRGQSARPGGDRHGWAAGAQAQTRLNEKFSAELGWVRQGWRSDTAYSPGLIDMMRHQDTDKFRAALLMPINPQQTLQLEWRSVKNRENITLFQYNSSALELSWRWQAF